MKANLYIILFVLCSFYAVVHGGGGYSNGFGGAIGKQLK
jgi:hypothetical protein